jgi:hypothetical protein
MGHLFARLGLEPEYRFHAVHDPERLGNLPRPRLE